MVALEITVRTAKNDLHSGTYGGAVANPIPDKSAFQAAMKPVYDKFLAENPTLKPLVEIIQNTP